MAKTLTIMLLSDSAENEDGRFAVGLADAVLRRGDRVNLFLYGNGVHLSKKEIPIEGPLHIAEKLLAHIGATKLGGQIEDLAKRGANIASCHTNEHARGIESRPYLENVKWGDIGHTFCDFLLVSHALIVLHH